jgi:hypothetical protein
LGGASAAEKQCALSTLDMGSSSCGFDRACNRPAMNIKGTKKVAYCPHIWYFPQSLTRRLASPLFLPAALSYYKVLAVALMD